MNNRKLEEVLQYNFKNRKLLQTALNHGSYCMEQGMGHEQSNQRLEFLGDAFFDAIISVELFNRMEGDEGTLSRTRATIVCENSLATVAEHLEIGKYLNLGKGENNAGGRHKKSLQADAVEAIVGAMFLDGGYDAAKEFVLREFKQIIDDAIEGKIILDYKTKVQEEFQKSGKNIRICYELDRATGPDHDKTFYVHLNCNGKRYGSGSGKTKKEAEQQAAKATIEGGI